MTAVELMRAWLEVFAEGEFDAFPGEVSPDFVLRLPFVPPGVASEIRGREAVQKALRETGKRRSRLVFQDVVVRRTEDPELLVTTARAEATMASGRVYRNEYIMLTRIRDGMVLEHVEYLNPLAVMESFADTQGSD
jgi:ketosteroid isomerase-like protein